MRRSIIVPVLILLVIVAMPGVVQACACGCSVFDVGYTLMFPDYAKGGMLYFEYDFMNQSRNWSGTGPSDGANNSDKDIKSKFYTLGLQYKFNKNWGLMLQVPYWSRGFQTTDATTGDIVSFDHSAMGDMRIMGTYSGFFRDASSGIIFGTKLPTGDDTYANFDPDTEIGTGSTDAIVGAYHLGDVGHIQNCTWFAKGIYEAVVSARADYRPGNTLDAAAGLAFDLGRGGGFDKVTPVIQALVSDRASDNGALGHPGDSGYSRLLLSPGLEVKKGRIKAYADLEFPVVQSVNGNQLTAPVLVKAVVGYTF